MLIAVNEANLLSFLGSLGLPQISDAQNVLALRLWLWDHYSAYQKVGR